MKDIQLKFNIKIKSFANKNEKIGIKIKKL